MADEFVYALTAGAPENSAIFSGTVLDENGNPMENVSINIQWQQNNTWLSKQILVDENGFFEQENLTPALTRVDVIKDGLNTKMSLLYLYYYLLQHYSSLMVSLR